MGLRREDVERDTQDREERFRWLSRLRRYLRGQREHEPLAAGVRDEC